MKEITPLTSKNGESEWPYNDMAIIAVPEIDQCSCHGCIGWKEPHHCPMNFTHIPGCINDFNKPIIYIEKPAETK